MAVTNTLGTGRLVPVPNFSPRSSLSSPSSSSSSSSLDFCSKKSINLRFVLDPSRNFQKPFIWHRKNSRLCCRCSDGTNNNSSISSYEWDWYRWTRHFSTIEQAESFVSVLKFQLEDAIEKEDFEEAAKLKMAIAEATLKDSVAEIMSQLKNAIDDERYHDASKLSRITGSGLVGWWVGCSKDSDDPFGRLVRITPGVGRFVGRSYSPRQLVTAAPGTPLFEIFVVKEAEETYIMQVVFLQRAKGSSTSSTSSLSNSKLTKGPSDEIENAPEVEDKENDNKTDKSEKNINIEGATEEGIKSVINFLREKIPDLKVKVMNINVTEEITEDNDSVKQLQEDIDNDSVKQLQEDIESSMPSDSSEDEADNLDDSLSDNLGAEEDDNAMEEGKSLDMKLFVGGVLHNKEDTPSKDEFVRQPAEIKDMERDSFVLHVPVRSQGQDAEKGGASKVKVSALAAQSVSELMPPDVAKAFLSSDKVSPKISKNVREIIKLAVSQAQMRERLSEYSNFSRINTSKGDLDPFDGLYVGAFGPYGTEVVQLRRKYGNWNGLDDANKSLDMEFFEYVEAVKLTGDLNVPAGQVTFRAKIGKGSRLSNRGIYPEELGVVASYKGQGRIAEFGFKNPKWVEGELLQLNGKGLGQYVKGADLGFLYVVPEQSFLVLFNRLKLPE